ncbi:hypothetical protein ACS8Y6_06675 [Salinisphaera sp. RV14]|uniref:hypothetical protein n=1 Tax=Salinisphaera sp. RV14 TaxID=3454140 RepID=UPI003F8477C6
MKRGGIAAIVVIAIAIIGAAIYGTGALRHAPAPNQPSTGQAPAASTSAPAANASGNSAANKPAPNAKAAAATQKPAESPAERYCASGHGKADIHAITQAGGLVQIFQHEGALADAYGCAKAYLKHGGKVNAVDPRADSKHLTPLLFAIKRNDPKMVHFMLDHGADPHQRGGPHHIKPYGYAVFEALHHQSTNYNAVINILDSALGDQPAASSGS